MRDKPASQFVHFEIVQSLVRDHAGVPNATLIDYEVDPITSHGVSGNAIYRVRLRWRDPNTHEAEWIIKCWRRGGHSAAELALTHSVETAAFQHGLLRPTHDSLRLSGIRSPYIGVYQDAEHDRNWIAMEDVGSDLTAYSRAHRISLGDAIDRAKHILARLACFHVYWEAPGNRAGLKDVDWLLPLEDVLWKSAATYVRALGEEPQYGRAKGREDDPILPAKLDAFLGWLPVGDRALWRELICDRRALVAAYQELPQTLLHGDLDDRNIGLCWSTETEFSPELVLIDWEWMGVGPAALDVAKIMHQFGGMCLPSPNEIDTYFLLLEELPAHYFEHYLTAGGQRITPAMWRKSFGLGMLKEHMTPFPHVIGGLILAAESGKESRAIPGVIIDEFDLVLEWAERSAAYVTAEMSHWL